MNYHQIKKKELETTKDYSNKKLNRYIRSHKILMSLSSELFFWSISFLVFMIFPYFLGNTIDMFLFFLISHLLYWRLYGVYWYKKEMTSLTDELILTIKVLDEIKKERNE